MKLKLIITLLLIISSINLIAQSPYELGLKYYNLRAENAVGLIAPEENINNCLSNLEKIFGTSKEEKAAVLHLKAIYFKSTYCHSQGDRKRKEILDEGKKIGSEMIIKHPNSAPIHYWHAVILGTWAKENGVIAAAKEGILDILKNECEKVIELDDTCENGAGYLFLGILNLEAPYIPFFLTWPDNDKAVELMKKALDMNPTNISNQYYLAKALNQTKRKEEAIELLQKAVKQKPNPDRILEDTSELGLCNDLLNDLKK